MAEQVGAIEGPSITKVNKVMLSLHGISTSAANKVYSQYIGATNPAASTIEGFKYIYPSGDGFNGITLALDPLEDNNGLVNSHGKYVTDPETGELTTPKRTFMTMG